MSLMLKYIRVGLQIVSVSIQGSIPQYSTIFPRHGEYTINKVKYLILVEARDNNYNIECLQCFAEYESQFLILTISDITTGDRERIDSRGGIYYKPRAHRNRLTIPETVLNDCISLRLLYYS